MKLADFPEMMTIDGKSDGQRQQFRTLANCPQQQLPVLKAFFAENTKPDTRAEKRHATLKIHLDFNFGALVFLQKCLYPIVVMFG